jgi:hypothetical protein
MQNFTPVSPSQSILSSLQLLLDNDRTAMSLNAGVSFPTENLFVGMVCLRTDTMTLHVLASLSVDGAQWLLVSAGTPGDESLREQAFASVRYDRTGTRAVFHNLLDEPVGEMDFPAATRQVFRTAGEDISALTAVWEDETGCVRPLDHRDVAHIHFYAGVTATAAHTGETLQVQHLDVLNTEGLSLTPDPGRVWLGENGRLVQARPVSGFALQIGVVFAPSRLLLRPSIAIKLE